MREENIDGFYFCDDKHGANIEIQIKAVIRDYRDDTYLDRKKQIIECHEILMVGYNGVYFNFDKMNEDQINYTINNVLKDKFPKLDFSKAAEEIYAENCEDIEEIYDEKPNMVDPWIDSGISIGEFISYSDRRGLQ